MSPAFLQHFSDRPVKSGHFVTLAFDRPDRPGVFAGDGQWTLPPLAPRFTKNVVFITNGSAVSYSESILSVIAGNRLADIVGEPSAGANGNITVVDLPGGYQVSWTGMKVTNADGSRHYLLGIQPTVPARRTVAGIQAGRDELLDRALALVKSRLRNN
jgi:C-terminal processing protease CtpA/Prc